MNIKNTIRRTAASTLAALALLAPVRESRAEEFKLLDAETIRHPYVETTYASDTVYSAGGRVKGPGIQNIIDIDLNKKLTFEIWQNYALKENSFNERDFCLTFKQPINKSLTAVAGLQYWDYPSKKLGKFDEYGKLGLNYSGPINAKLTWGHVFWDQGKYNGDFLHLKLSKTLPIAKSGNISLEATPGISGAWANDLYGFSGLAHVTPSLGAKLSLNKRLSLIGNISHQIPLNSRKPEFSYWNVGGSYQF